MRNSLLVLCLFGMGCGSGEAISNRMPAASLKLPACVVAGTTVTLDASGSTDPDDNITTYVFTIGHDLPPLVNNKPTVKYRFSKPRISGNKIEQYQVLLTVVDADGLQDSSPGAIFVVFKESQCPDDAQPIVTDLIEEDLYYPDVFAPDDVWSPDVSPVDIIPVDVVTPDLPSKDVTGVCPNVSGAYRLQIFCFGSTEFELEVDIVQKDGCAFEEELGIFAGTIDGDGFMKLDSAAQYEVLHISHCEGYYDDPENFSLECTSNCTAVFLLE